MPNPRPCTKAPAIFLRASARILPKVGRDTFMLRAAPSWSRPSWSASLTASSSSMVITVSPTGRTGKGWGRKNTLGGSNPIQRGLTGRAMFQPFAGQF